jgi:hypothetical protein
MTAVAWSLALRLWGAQAAVALAVAALASVAALIEGHAPSPRLLASAGLVAGAILGAAWVLGRWRAEGGDVALANVGVPPSRVVLLLAALSVPALAVAPAARPPGTGGWSIETAPGRLRVSHPAGALDVVWRGDVARRSDTGAELAGLPAPEPLAPPARTPWTTPAVRAALLLAMLAWLGRRSAPPGPALTVGAALAVTAAAHAAGALLST